MAFRFQYDNDPLVQGAADFEAALLLRRDADMRQDERLAEAQRQFNVRAGQEQAELGFRYDALDQEGFDRDLDRGFRYDALGAEMEANAARMFVDEQRAQADMVAQEEATRRAELSQFAQSARLREEQRFDKAVSDQDAIWKAFTEGKIDEQQFGIMQGQWEERNGMQWGLPRELAMEQNEQAKAQRIAQIEAGFVSRISGQPLIPEGQVQAWFDLNVPPEKIMQFQGQLHAEDRQLFTQQQKPEIEKNKIQWKAEAEAAANEIENQREDTKTQQEMSIKKREFEQKQQIEDEKMLASVFNTITKIKESRAQAKIKAAQSEIELTDEMLGPEPTIESLLPPEVQARLAARASAGGEPEWYKALPMGAIYTDPNDGKTKRKTP